MRYSPICCLAVVFATGCGGGSKLAPVSGVVKLNGEPYANALVAFQPMGSKDNPNPGRGSMGQTDASGRYFLKQDGTEVGAVVGTHRIRISTLPGHGVASLEPPPATGSPDGILPPKGGFKVEKADLDPIPLDWNERSEKTFEVKPGGTDKADFDIVGQKVPKK